MRSVFLLPALLFLTGVLFQAQAQFTSVGIGTGTTDSSSVLDAFSVNQGMLTPRNDTTAVNAAWNPVAGLLIYQTADKYFYYFDGIKWVRLLAGVFPQDAWKLTGNLGTNAATNYIGTNDLTDWVIKTNNAERMRITSGGLAGIGTASPAVKMHVKGTVAADNTNGLQLAMLTDDGGVELYRDPLGSTPGVNGFIDFKDSIPDDSDFRIYYNGSIESNGALMFQSTTDGSFLNTGIARMVILNSSGNTGIGTTLPDEKLVVEGNRIKLQNIGASKGIYLRTDGTETDIGSFGADLWVTAKTNLDIILQDEGQSTGYVGIGTSTPSSKLEVWNGSTQGSYTTAGWTHSSDARLKKNITPLEPVLGKLLNLQATRFDLTNDEDDSGKHIGFIAQELEKHFPEFVTTTPEGIKSVAYGNISAVLLKGLQEQQVLIEVLHEENKGLITELENLGRLETEIENLKVRMNGNQ